MDPGTLVLRLRPLSLPLVLGTKPMHPENPLLVAKGFRQTTAPVVIGKP